jgi:uncharacterized protein YndB with AHSA1/START domain
MRNEYSIEINAAPERVFPLLSSSERALEWLPNLAEARDLEVTPHGVGSRFRHVYLERGRRMEMTGTVKVFEPNRRLGATLEGALFDLDVDYRLEDLRGRTRVTQVSAIRFKSAAMRFVMTLLAPLMRKAGERNAAASFGKLKELVERQA